VAGDDYWFSAPPLGVIFLRLEEIKGSLGSLKSGQWNAAVPDLMSEAKKDCLRNTRVKTKKLCDLPA